MGKNSGAPKPPKGTKKGKKGKGRRALAALLLLASLVGGCAAIKKDPTIVTDDDKVKQAAIVAAECGVQVGANFILRLLEHAEAAHARAAKAGAVAP